MRSLEQDPPVTAPDVSSPESDAASALAAQTFVARQPIFDRRKDTCGYELLFRRGFANVLEHADADQASPQVIADTDALCGLTRLAGGERAFITFTPETLTQGYAFVMSPQSLVVQIDHALQNDARVVEACRQLKQAGYAIALVGVRAPHADSPLVPLADMVKVEFAGMRAEDRAALASMRARNIALVAMGIDTAAAFTEAVQAGYTYFGGSFVGDPDIRPGESVPAFKSTQLELLRELGQPALDRVRLQGLIKHDAVVVLKLLRYVNSAAVALRRRVESVEHAMAILGDEALRRFLRIMTLRTLSSDGPRELAVQSAVRAVFFESLAAPAGAASRAGELLLLGLFSLLAPIMRRPLRDVLDDVPVTPEVRGALLGEPNALREFLRCGLAYERGDWDAFASEAQVLGIPEGLVPARYAHALEHATVLISYENAAGGASV